MAKGFHLSAPPVQANYDIPIFQKVYDFYKELYLSLTRFPKIHRYSLGQRLDSTTLEVFESLVAASTQEPIQKLLLLEKASTKLETLKLLIRLAKDTQSLDNKRYIHLENYLQEIGKMLGGWLKHTKAR